MRHALQRDSHELASNRSAGWSIKASPVSTFTIQCLPRGNSTKQNFSAKSPSNMHLVSHSFLGKSSRQSVSRAYVA